jgi:diguanylate cyclase (GGDEF)-like protein
MDVRTILIVESSLLLFLAVILLLVHHSHRRTAPDVSIRWFFASNVLGAIGFFLLAERGEVSDWLTILFGNFCAFLMGALLNRAVAETTEQRNRSVMGLLILLSTVTMIFFAYFTYWRPNKSLRMELCSLVLAVAMLATAHILLTCKLKSIRPATRVMGLLLLLFSVGSIARAILVGKYNFPDAPFVSLDAFAICGVTLCFLWIDSLKLRAEFELQATTDPLTGLYNRRAIESLAQREISRASRTNLSIAALMLDMDRFKLLNDTYGHAVGDQALCAVARALEQSVRNIDLVARLSGDEFLVILPEANAADAQAVVQRIRVAIERIRIVVAGAADVIVECSIGSTSVKAKSTNLAELLRQSDIALYISKSEAPLREKMRRAHRLSLVSDGLSSIVHDAIFPLEKIERSGGMSDAC